MKVNAPQKRTKAHRQNGSFVPVCGSVMFEPDGVDEEFALSPQGRQLVAFFNFRLCGGIGVEKVPDRFVPGWIGDESLRISEFSDPFEFRQQFLRKYQPKLFNSLLSIEFEPRLFGNLKGLRSRQRRRAPVCSGRRKEDDKLRFGRGWTFVEDVQMPPLWSTHVHSDLVVRLEIDLAG